MGLLLSRIENIRVEIFFVVAAFLFGMTTLLMTPPFQAPDEHNHFARAYQISEGGFMARRRHISPEDEANVYEHINCDCHRYAGEDASGAYLPISLAYLFEMSTPGIEFHPENKYSLARTFSLIDLPFDEGRRVFFHFGNTAVYSPVPYIPQALAIAIGRAMQCPPLILMYMGREANLLVWICLVYFAVKVWPHKKLLLLLLALMPMSLFQAASLSADGFTNGVSFLFISLTMKLSYQEEELKKRDYALLGALSLMVSLSKTAYVPLVFLACLIPIKREGERARGLRAVSLMLFVSIAAAVAWTASVKDLYIPYSFFASSQGQLAYIAGHPLAFVGVLLSPFHPSVFLGLIETFIGVLGWLDTPFPLWFYMLTVCVFIAAMLFDDSAVVHFIWGEKILFLLCVVASSVLIETAQYLYWMDVGSTSIALQGRYFIPLVPLIFIPFTRSLPIRFPYKRVAVYSFSLFSCVYMIMIIVNRYYG